MLAPAARGGGCAEIFRVEKDMTETLARPNVATIFGILDIVFGILGISNLKYLNTMNQWLGSFYNIVLMTGVALAVLLLAAGLFLLTNRGPALKLNMYYAYASIALTVIRSGYLVIQGGIAGLMIGIVSSIITLIYPVLILVILLKDDTTRAFYGR
jgi:hypothetical protein